MNKVVTSPFKIPPLLMSVASSVCLIVSFPYFNLYYAAWLGILPILYISKISVSPSRAFWWTYLSGFVFFSGTIYWLGYVTVPGTIAFVAYLAIYFGLFGLGANYFIKSYSLGKMTPLSFLFVIPSLWVVTEYLRAHIFTGFGWASLGYSQAFNLPAIQIADITGVYGISFILVMFSTGVFILLDYAAKKKELPHEAIIVFLVILFVVFGYGIFRMNNIFTGETLKVGIVQGNIPQSEKWDSNRRDMILGKYENLTLDLKSKDPELVIWPETAVPGYLETERDIENRLESLARNMNTNLLVGSPREDSNNSSDYYNSAFLFSGNDGSVIGLYDKVHLVPFGEYVPLKKIFSFVENFAPSPIGDFSAGRESSVFKFTIERTSHAPEVGWKMMKKVMFSCLICFEDLFPELSRRSVANGATFLVNITNDAWFGRSSAPYQHMQCSVMRAVENRVNVIRAANTGISCIIDQKGKVIERVKNNGSDTFVDGATCHGIVLSRTKTLYSVYGDVIVYLSFIIVCINVIIGRFRRRKILYI